MSRYYFNENPQVTSWKEEAYKWKSIAKACIQTAHECNETTEDYKRLVAEANEQTRKSLALSKEWAETANDILDRIKSFNSLPWYRKMFYTFKIPKARI